jgi:serine/threonine protein kinase/uncharacterized RDD family membrane protein YckC
MSFCINSQCPKPKNPTESRFCPSCGSDLLLGGRYRVTRLLSAKGGFGHTYEAIDTRGTPKVLKVLTYDSPKAVELFQQEVRVLQQLHHPGIPKGESYFIYHPRESETLLHCLVMEKIEGIDLEEYEREREFKPIDPLLALDWLKQLGQILHEVHQHHFFHRDIKPSNIILQPNGQLVLIDFGAARQVTKTVLAGGQNTGIYTPGYAPPEQSSGHSVPQSDFYALGKTLIFLLTGKEPSDPTIYNINTNQFNWRQYAPQITPRLANFIEELIAERPVDRPANTVILLQRITEITADFNKRTQPRPPLYLELLSKLETLSTARSSSPDPRSNLSPELLEKLRSQSCHPPRQNFHPDKKVIHYAGFWLRFKASILDAIFLIFFVALTGGYICFRLQEFENFNQLNLDFYRIQEFVFLGKFHFGLDLSKSLWMYYAAGLSALGTTTIGIFLVVAEVIYKINTKSGFLPEEIALLLTLGLGISMKWLYFILFESCFKGTIGKIFLDLSVTDTRGRRLSIARANRRYWSKIFSTIPLYLGFFLAGWTSKKRALHDMITGTQILKKK